MRKISTAKLRKWLLVGLGFGAAVSALLGALPICDYGQGLALNLATELAGALVTYVLLQLVIGRREEEEAKRTGLIAQMGSQVLGDAIRAVEELRRHGWLHNGSLQGANLEKANLEGADLVGANLQEALLRGVNLQGANLQMANLRGASLDQANLQGIDLSRANLERANLIWANLQRADLVGANLQGAFLVMTDLQGAGLLGTNLQGATLNEAILPDGRKWIPGTDITRFTNPAHPDFWLPDAQ